MKRIAFSLMVLVVALTTACNQSSKNSSQSETQPNAGPGNFNPEEMVSRQIDQMKESLDLNEEQVTQVRTLITENFDNMKKMRENKGDRQEMRAQMEEAREELNKKIKTILSDEQWVKYEAFEKEQMSRRGQRRPEGSGRPE